MAKTPKTSDEQPSDTAPLSRCCGTMEVHTRLLRTVAGYREVRDLAENQALRASMNPMIGRSGCTRIPVVVHVVYRTAAQNISDAQIQSQIDALNADFRKKNTDVGTVPSAFAPLATDTRIEFELARTDPSGNPTTGITRTSTTVTSFSHDDDGVKSTATGGANAWPADKYLNIWVCQLSGGLLGYAQFPGGPAATDGVVIRHSAFGTTGTAAAPFNLGRTTTHEVGHWLNLRHIWGDDGTGCSGSDFVADTPNQGGPNYGTPTFPRVSCDNGPNGDMFMNYMDYVDDAAMVMFSAGQVTRMQATLDGLRSTIGSSIPCTGGGKTMPKDLHKDTPKDLPKDVIKDAPKDGIKDLPKDGVKDFPKDMPKDHPKDLPKDIIKEQPKDGVKDWPKELPKDLAKDGILDPVKPLAGDLPPKSVMDPPKGLFEPPVDFPFGGIPVANPALGGGAQPFVLATGAGAASNRGPGDALLAGFQQLLAQYARLYAAGQLDAAGQAAWRELSAAYQRLIGGGA